MDKIDKNVFLRNFSVYTNKSFDVLIGSGASISSGIHTGEDLVWHFKKEIYCQNKGLSKRSIKDMQVKANQVKVQSFFDERGDSAKKIENEYSFYFEECYSDSEARNDFVAQLMKDKSPSLGYQCLAELIYKNRIGVVWTTNFDDLIEKAIVNLGNKSCSVISTENKGGLEKYDAGIPSVVKLHGDFRYDSLQNIESELQKMEAELENKLLDSIEKRGLIVIGYSGRDKSVMNALRKALTNQASYPKGLIWCIPLGVKPSDKLIDLIKKAKNNSENSGFVEIESFDTFMYEMYRICDGHNKDIEYEYSKIKTNKIPFMINRNIPSLPLLLNAMKLVEYPGTVYATSTKINDWKELRNLLKETRIVGGFHRDKTLFWGDEKEIIAKIGPLMNSKLEPEDLEFNSSNRKPVYEGMLYDFIAKEFEDKYELRFSKRDRKIYSSEYLVSDYKGVLGKNIDIYEAFTFSINYIGENLYLTLNPTIHCQSKNHLQLNKEVVQEITNAIMSNRYNEQYSKILHKWLKKLKKVDPNLIFKLGEFELKLAKYFTVVGNIEGEFEKLRKFTKLNEPWIYFSHGDATKRTIHPLLGLKNFGSLEESFGDSTAPVISLGIISSDKKFMKIKKHLDNLKKSIQPSNEKDYIKEYPGFFNIYKKHIVVPGEISETGCCQIIESEIKDYTAIQFYDYLKKCIKKTIASNANIDCLIIFIQKDWERFEKYKSDYLDFDLHNSIKIFSAKQGVKVQLIKESSLEYNNQAKVMWWLSLGLFVKSNNIPWKVEDSNKGKAFVGIGYAVKQTGTNKIVLGSSQIFDATGNGLKLIMQPINKPVIIGKNPFMSKEDALNLLGNVRNTYNRIDPNVGLEKLVVHKTTQFTKEEIIGINMAMKGVGNIELIQIQNYTSWRAIKLKKKADKHVADGFPIERGTIILLDANSFLLWTHGVVKSDVFPPYNNYYQGKRGIPSPLLIKRYQGNDSIEELANDILKLTKVNWNGAELYKKQPVTISYSNVLSVMGKQDEELLNIPYDFRYFI